MIRERDIRKKIRLLAFEAGSQEAWADQAHVSEQAVGSFMSRARAPSRQLLGALGLERVTEVGYRRKASA